MFNWLRKIGLVLALLVLPAAAFAGSTLNPSTSLSAWDLYAFGNGQVLANILNSISAMMSDPGYAQLLWFLAVLGTFVTAVMAGFNMAKNGVRFLTYFFAVYLAIYAMVGTNGSGGIRANIAITDVVTHDVTMVSNAPAIIGVPAAIISEIGQWLTKKMEQTFSLPGVTYPDSMKMSNGGAFNMAASLMEDATKLQINNAQLSQSISNYTQDCVIPMIAAGQLDAGLLIKSTDLWASLATTNQGILTNYYSPTSAGSGGTVMSCADVYPLITADLTAYVPTLLSQAAGSFSNTGVGSILASRLDDASYWLTNGIGVGGGGAGMVKQAAVINQMSGAYSQMAASANNNVLMTSMAMEQAKQSQLSSWIASADIFKRMMGYIYAVLQAFIFGIVPIIAAAMLVPGLGMGILKSFGQILLWLVMWNPLFAVVSFIMASYAQTDLAPLLAAPGGGAVGLTMGSIGVVSSASNNMVAAAGFLGTMVPLIAWGLVKGQMAFTEFVTHGIGSSFANSAGAMAATGNVSLDNQSMGNQNFNKHSFGQKGDVGDSGVNSALGSGSNTITEMAGGLAGSIAGKAVTATGTSGNSTSSTDQLAASKALSTELASAESTQHSAQASVENSYQSLVTTAQQYVKTHNSGEVYEATKAWLHDQSHGTQAGVKSADSTALTGSVGGSSKVGAPTPSNVKTPGEKAAAIDAFKNVWRPSAGASVGADVKLAGTTTDTAERGESDATKDSVNNGGRSALSVGNSNANSTSGGSGDTAALRSAYSEADSSVKSLQKADKAVASAQHSIAVAEASTAGYAESTPYSLRAGAVDRGVAASGDKRPETNTPESIRATAAAGMQALHGGKPVNARAIDEGYDAKAAQVQTGQDATKTALGAADQAQNGHMLDMKGKVAGVAGATATDYTGKGAFDAGQGKTQATVDTGTGTVDKAAQHRKDATHLVQEVGGAGVLLGGALSILQTGADLAAAKAALNAAKGAPAVEGAAAGAEGAEAAATAGRAATLARSVLPFATGAAGVEMMLHSPDAGNPNENDGLHASAARREAAMTPDERQAAIDNQSPAERMFASMSDDEKLAYGASLAAHDGQDPASYGMIQPAPAVAAATPIRYNAPPVASTESPPSKPMPSSSAAS